MGGRPKRLRCACSLPAREAVWYDQGFETERWDAYGVSVVCERE